MMQFYTIDATEDDQYGGKILKYYVDDHICVEVGGSDFYLVNEKYVQMN